MITFKQFIVEGFSADFRRKLIDIKQELAHALGQPRHQVRVDRAQLQHGNGVEPLGEAIRFLLNVYKDDIDDQEFYQHIVERLIERSLQKHFGKFEKLDVDNIDFSDSPTARAIWARYKVPDAEGLM